MTDLCSIQLVRILSTPGTIWRNLPSRLSKPCSWVLNTSKCEGIISSHLLKFSIYASLVVCKNIKYMHIQLCINIHSCINWKNFSVLVELCPALIWYFQDCWQLRDPVPDNQIRVHDHMQFKHHSTLLPHSPNNHIIENIIQLDSKAIRANILSWWNYMVVWDARVI